jgi:hypothetical protein
LREATRKRLQASLRSKPNCTQEPAGITRRSLPARPGTVVGSSQVSHKLPRASVGSTSAQAIAPSALKTDIHEGALVKTRARRVRDFPDIHSASSAAAERHERVCGCPYSHQRRRTAPCRSSGCNLGPALDLDLAPVEPRLAPSEPSRRARTGPVRPNEPSLLPLYRPIAAREGPLGDMRHTAPAPLRPRAGRGERARVLPCHRPRTWARRLRPARLRPGLAIVDRLRLPT